MTRQDFYVKLSASKKMVASESITVRRCLNIDITVVFVRVTNCNRQSMDLNSTKNLLVIIKICNVFRLYHIRSTGNDIKQNI